MSKQRVFVTLDAAIVRITRNMVLGAKDTRAAAEKATEALCAIFPRLNRLDIRCAVLIELCNLLLLQCNDLECKIIEAKALEE